MKTGFLLLFLLLIFTPILYSQQTVNPQEILKKAIAKAKDDDWKSDRLGFHQDVTTKELDDDGKVDEQETRTYRTMWIENKPYPELIAVNGKPLNSKQQKEERNRQKKFVEALHDKKKADDEAEMDFTWDELARKYKFTLRPSQPDAYYVMDFEPASDDLPERNRYERVINHLHGTIYLDQDCNLLKAKAELGDTVGYGLGILAKVSELKVEYKQAKYRDIFVPVSFHATYLARILVKTLHKDVESKFYDIFEPPQTSPSK